MGAAVTNYAGFWKRFIAYLIDWAILFVVLVVLALVGLNQVLLNLVAIVAGWLYFGLMESSEKQATLGKIALGMVVTDESGNRITFGRASGRFFAKILSGIILAIGYIMAAFTAKKQALHDILAKTLVLNK